MRRFRASMRVWLLAVCLLGGVAASGGAVAQPPDVDQAVVSRQTHGISVGAGNWKIEQDDGFVLFLFGAFCALWAQNTRRNPWLWFFMGLFFSMIAVVVLLVKNSDDNSDRRLYGRTTRDVELDTAEALQR